MSSPAHHIHPTPPTDRTKKPTHPHPQKPPRSTRPSTHKKPDTTTRPPPTGAHALIPQDPTVCSKPTCPPTTTFPHPTTAEQYSSQPPDSQVNWSTFHQAARTAVGTHVRPDSTRTHQPPTTPQQDSQTTSEPFEAP
jgi:hypothetical protein